MKSGCVSNMVNSIICAILLDMDQKKMIMLYFMFKKWHLEMMGVVILTMFLTLDLVKRQYEMNMLRKCSYTNNQTRLLYLNSIIGGREIDCIN